MTGKIALIPGDGIGPEIVAEAKKVLDTVAKKYGHEFEYETLLMGGCSIDAYGEPLTEESLEKAKASDAVLLGCSRRKRRKLKMVSGSTKFTSGGRSVKDS